MPDVARAAVGRRVVGAIAAAACALLGTPGTSVAAVMPACRVLDLSPAYERDGTVFCATGTRTSFALFRSKDRGRTWVRFSNGVRLPDQAWLTQLVVSADYPNDRSVYLATSSALYASTDDGETFGPVDLLANDSSGRRILTRYLDTTAGVALPYLAFANYHAPARLRPPAHERVAGPLPAKANVFLIPSPLTMQSQPLVLGFSGSNETLTYTVYECTTTLACATPRGNLPKLGGFSGIWMSPHYPTDRTLYAAGEANGFTFVRSTDGGRTFQPWTSLNTALRPVTTAMTKRNEPQWEPPAVTFAGKNRIFVRLFSHLPDDGRLPPYQVILRSDDSGRTWRQVGTQYDTGGRRRGNLPFGQLGNSTSENVAQIYGAPDGRVFALGEGLKNEGPAPWCSVDGGVRWYRTCPK